ncbi:GNAT family N-acetyltransferase [Microscilla marina]|uniref:Acetyltransferase, gnat family n=1 Tax=Microscilla marina ATCC 23134 TaxID=313606 RepID=A1ZWV3_MICM2|nr:GNAT family N-acetyltransferase [Microscilla marina]EAY25130.1 acetyltransferase, gnat family [Microscilla marina ATCC 23134]
MKTLLKENIYIETASVQDAELLADLQCKMAWETEEYMLDRNTVLQGLQALFNDVSKGIYYKVTHNEQVIGCMLNTFEWSEWRNGYVLWIQSLYIVPEFRAQGLFKLMYQYLQHKVKADNNLMGIRLYVDKTNVKASQVYKAIGMSDEHYTFFEWLNE